MSKHSVSSAVSVEPKPAFVSFIDKALAWGLGLLCLLVSVSFYTATYDTAFVKITLLQMGGIVLSVLWFALLAVQKRCPVTRKNLVWLLPFLAYFGWNLITFCFAPYKMEGAEELFRYILYFLISLLVLDRFSKESLRVLTKCIVLAAWISCLYGAVQVLDRWVPVDIMPWRGFFGTRIFSTHSNPNFFADFVVFSSFIVLAEYLRTRQKRLLALLGLETICLFFSESKGAWLGFASSLVFFAALYTHAAVSLKKHVRKIYAAAAVLLLGTAVLVGVYAAKRFQSVSFRAYTWSSVFAMVQDSPVLGTGVGSFKIIYPAYRKPQIFYIEKMHNNETQHAENEYLEQWATAGTVGLALFLWLVFFVLRSAFGALGGAVPVKKTEPKQAPEKWWLMGYSAAFFGILVHNFFDISMRFVSTGLFFAVFAALLVRLSMKDVEISLSVPARPPRFKNCFSGLFVLLIAAVLGTAGLLFVQFIQFSKDVSLGGGLGGVVLLCASIAVFGAVTLGAAWVYIRAAFLSRSVWVPLLLIISLVPVYFCFGFFQADHYYGIAVGFSQRGMADGSLEFYQKAIEKNPFVVSYRQYRGYILRQTADLARSYTPVKGDPKPQAGQPLWTDYDRVVRDFELVLRRAPNNALLHQSMGEFYYDYAVRFTKLSVEEQLPYRRAEYEAKAVKNMELAKKSFRRSLLLDPVNESTYLFLANIAMMERDPAASQAWIEAYRRGPEGVYEPEFLAQHKQSFRLDALERRLRQPPFNYFPSEVSQKEGEK